MGGSLARPAFESSHDGVGEKRHHHCATRSRAVLLLAGGVIVASALTGCRARSERDQYLVSRSFAVPAGLATPVDRPTRLFANHAGG